MKKISRLIVSICVFALLLLWPSACDIDGPGPDTQKPDDQAPADPYLGRGYEVSMDYAKPVDAKSMVLDTAKLQQDGLVETLSVSQTENLYSYGSCISDYCSKLAVNTQLNAGYQAFSGSARTNFATNNQVYTSHSFATFQTIIYGAKTQVPESVSTETLQSYLKSDAQAAINDMGVTPEQLFDTYGTHVMTGLITGRDSTTASTVTSPR